MLLDDKAKERAEVPRKGSISVKQIRIKNE
jgi:hypothetical protein